MDEKCKSLPRVERNRAKPINEPAPLLKQLEPGLLINTGHYRNGVLLAPACAEWVGIKIENQ